MQNLARTILESYIFEKKVLTPKDLPSDIPLMAEKLPAFVTVYDGENVVGSSGRIYPIHNTTLEELIDNTLLITQDHRFGDYLHNPERARKLRYRVDIFRDHDRRLLHHPDDLNSASEGIIVLCQKQEKVGIILPHMLPPNLSGEEVYHRALAKVQIDTKRLGKGDIILYGLKTETYEE